MLPLFVPDATYVFQHGGPAFVAWQVSELAEVDNVWARAQQESPLADINVFRGLCLL